MTKFENLTIKELESHLSEVVKDVKIETIERREVRGAMVRHIKDTFPDYDIGSFTSDDSQFAIHVNGIRLEFKPSVKGTKEMVQVTKTRLKEKVVPNKINFSRATKSIRHPYYEFESGSKIIEHKKNGWTSSSTDLSWKKSCKTPIGEMLTKERIGDVIPLSEIIDNYYGEIRGKVFTRIFVDGKRVTPYKVEPVLYEYDSIRAIVPDHWITSTHSHGIVDGVDVIDTNSIDHMVRINVEHDYKEEAMKYIAEELNWKN